MITAKEALKIQQAARRKAEKDRQQKINVEMENIDRKVRTLSELGRRRLEYQVSNEKYIEALIFTLQNDENKFVAKKIHSTILLIEW